MSKCVGPCVRVQDGHKPDDCFLICQNDESGNFTMTIDEDIESLAKHFENRWELTGKDAAFLLRKLLPVNDSRNKPIDCPVCGEGHLIEESSCNECGVVTCTDDQLRVNIQRGKSKSNDEENHTSYDLRCCHKTVFTRCEGCPYDEIKKA